MISCTRQHVVGAPIENELRCSASQVHGRRILKYLWDVTYASLLVPILSFLLICFNVQRNKLNNVYTYCESRCLRRRRQRRRRRRRITRARLGRCSYQETHRNFYCISNEFPFFLFFFFFTLFLDNITLGFL